MGSETNRCRELIRQSSILFRIGEFLVQTPLGAWPGSGTQPC